MKGFGGVPRRRCGSEAHGSVPSMVRFAFRESSWPGSSRRAFLCSRTAPARVLRQEGLVQSSPNKSLQRSAGHIKCLAAGEDAPRPSNCRAPACRQGRLAAAELSRSAS